MHPSLERNEVIALINLLERLSHSIEIVRDMYKQLAIAGSSASHAHTGSHISGSTSSSGSVTGTPDFLQNLSGHLHDAL